MHRTYTTPGIDFLARNLLFPTSVPYAALTVVARHFEVSVPRWLLITASILLIPTRLALSTLYTYRKHQKQAEALGARLPPVIDSKSFGNWKTMVQLEESMTVGYPGMALGL